MDDAEPLHARRNLTPSPWGADAVSVRDRVACTLALCDHGTHSASRDTDDRQAHVVQCSEPDELPAGIHS